MKLIKYLIIHTLYLPIDFIKSYYLHKNGVKVLDELFILTHKLKIPCWIDGGTLLGIVREGNFLKKDTDIDVALFFDEKINLFEILINHNFSINSYFEDENEDICLIKAQKNKVNIDINIFYKNLEYSYRDSPRRLPKFNESKNYKKESYAVLRYKFKHDTLRSFKIIKFSRININIPEQYDLYLDTYYKNWKIKQNNFNYYFKINSFDTKEYRHHNNLAEYIPNKYLVKRFLK